ncbi:hypothetical protein H5T56_04970 [Candidatus Bipolaricaulota bacterium]|nr:hypothetical protein [Candidatus Bipolaricaulota bacterium]
MGAPWEVMVVAALRTELLFVRGPKAALGVGAKARARLRTVLERCRPSAVAIVGYAGGLRADLPPGILILADSVLDKEGEVRADEQLLSRAKELLPHAQVGPIFTDEKLTPLAEKTELEKKALAVDMESSHLARELFSRRIPFLVGRVVLDARWEEAPQGPRALLWAGRALRCSWVLGRAAPALRTVLAEAI